MNMNDYERRQLEGNFRYDLRIKIFINFNNKFVKIKILKI